MTSVTIDRNGFIVNHLLSLKGPCRVATTANITLSGIQSIDGVTVDADDRVLVKDQSTATQNGIYLAKSGDWELAQDFDQRGQVVKGTRVLVVEGTTQAMTEWVVTTSDRPIPGRSSISFTNLTDILLSASDLSVDTISIGATDTTLSRSAAGDVAVEGNAIYRAGGTDVPVADGGTGRSLATAFAVLCGGTTDTGAHQSVASVGTSGHVLTSNGAGALPTFQAASGGLSTIAVQVFTTPGANTYTPTSGMTYCLAISTGGGGGGGGADSDGSSLSSAGGGGAGATCIELFTAATIGVSQTVTVGAAGLAGSTAGGDGGAGGDTTFGALHTAGGGSGGVGTGSAPNTITKAGGAGGTGSGGNMNITGGDGANSGIPFDSGASYFAASGGTGGASYWGGGGRGGHVDTATAEAGVAGKAYGSGGGGGGNRDQTAGIAGGAGATGAVIVLEFIA